MEVRAQPSRAAAWALLALGVVLAVLSVTTDAAGAVLAVPGTGLALGAGLRDLLLVPVLRADREGLEVREGVRRRALRWDEVDGLRVVTDRRAALLELELADDRVVLLSRGRLGRDPRDVLDELRALRPAAR